MKPKRLPLLPPSMFALCFTAPRSLSMPKVGSLALAVAATLSLGSQSAQAATSTKGASGTDLTDAGSWSALPTAADIATWDTGSLGAGLTLNAGTPSWLGIKVNAGASDPIVIGSGGTLTLGTSGIDMSAATQNLTISSGLTIGAGNQVWNVASGRTLTLNTGTFTRSAGATLNLQGSGTFAASMTGLTNTSSIIGPWATIGTGASTRYVTLSGSNLSSFTGSTVLWTDTINSATTNFEITSNTGATYGGSFRVANTIRYAGTGVTMTLGNSSNGNGLNANGILNAGTGTLLFNTAGSGTAGFVVGSSAALVLNAANAGISITAPIHNNGTAAGTYGTTASAVTVTGTSGVTLGGANTFTGNLNVNSGTLSAGLALGDPAAATTQGSALGNIGTAVARTININNGATLSLTAGNTLGTGGSTNTLSAITLAVNPGGVFQTGSQTGSGGFWNKIGAINLNNGIIHVGTGANNGAFQGLALLGTVTVGGSAASTIDNFAGSTSGSNGIHLGQNATANQSITFNVADVTGNANADLTISPALLNTSSTQTASGLAKSGTGTLLLTGANSYTGATVISGGILQVGNSNAATLGGGSYAGAISGSGTLAFNSTAAQSLTGGITGATILTKDGSGALTITNSNALGAVTLTTGTLNINGTTTAGNTSVGSGTTLGAKMTAVGTNALTLGGSSLTFGTSTLAIDFNSLNPTAAAINLSTGTLTLNGTVTPTFSNTSGLASGNYTLIDYGTLAGAGSFSGSSISLGARSSGSVSNDAGNTNIILSVTTDKPVWTGLNGSAWVQYALSSPTTGTPNFALGSAHTATDFWTSDDVQFNDTYNLGAGDVAVSNGNVTINTGGAVNAAGVAANSITFNNSAIDYTVSGSGAITGGSVMKNGSGKVTFTTANTYTGATTIGAGTLQLGDGTTDGSIASTSGVTNNGTLAYNLAGSQTAGYAISGAGAVTKAGAGTLVLSTANAYTGGTAINGGVVSIAADNNLGTSASAVTLNGGTLKTTAGITNTHAVTIGGSGGTINVTTTGQYFFNTANTLLGSGPLTVTGNGTLAANTGNLRIAQTNTYSGAVTLNSGGIFEYGIAGAVGSGATFEIGNQGELAVQNGTALPNAITVSGGTNSVLSYENGTTGDYSGPVTLNASATVGLRDWYNNATVRGGTISGQITGSGGITVNSGTGSGGTLTLSNVNNTYSGGTTISASKVAAITSGAIGTGAVTIGGTGSQLILGGTTAGTYTYSPSGTTLNGGGATAQGVIWAPNPTTGSNTVTYNGPVNITANAASGGHFGSGNLSTLNITGAVTSSVAVTSRIGTVVFSNTGSSYSQLTVNEGTVRLGATNALPVAASVDLGASGAATFDLAGFNQTLAGITKNTNGATVTNSGLTDSMLTTTGTSTFGGVIQNGATNKTALTVNGGTFTLTGANTFTGATVVNSGTLYANTANAANNRALSFTSDITVNTGATLQSGANALFGWDGTQEKNILVNAGGTLTADNGADVGVATVTLAGGTLTSAGTSTAYGSWRFDNATDKLQVTENSTISAVNVKFGNAGAALEVAAGKTANFTGSITDATSGGISYLNKTGAGTLNLTGANTYTGATTISAGTLFVNGSLGNTALVVNGGTLGGSGTIGSGTATVEVNSGGTISPGNSPGTLTINGSTTLNAGSTFAFQYTGGVTPGDADLVDVNGTLTIANGALLTLEDLGTYTMGNKFTLFAYDSFSGGSFDGYADDSTFTVNGGEWTINYNDDIAGSNGGTGTGFVTLTAVPEPGAVLLGGLGMLALLRRRR